MDVSALTKEVAAESTKQTLKSVQDSGFEMELKKLAGKATP